MFCEQCATMTRRLSFDPSAGFGAELFTGSCIWNDECCPRWCIPCSDATRALFHARYCMTVGAPVSPEVQSLWEQTRTEFPDWPLFRPERRSAAIAGDVRRLVEEQLQAECGPILAMMEAEGVRYDPKPLRPPSDQGPVRRFLRWFGGLRR